MLCDFNNIITNLYCEKNKLENIENNEFKEFKDLKEFKNFKSNISELKNRFVNRYTNYYFNNKYITDLLSNKSSKLICLSIDKYFNSNNIPSILIYRKMYTNNNIVRISIFVISTLKKARGLGYGKLILDLFCDYIKEKYKNKNIELILHSLDNSIEFYINYGFEEIKNSVYLSRIEGYSENSKFFKLKV